MASNSEYEQRNFWENQDLSLLGDSWMNEQVKLIQNKMHNEAERLFYTAQEGSLLDRIWKGEFKKKK